ncbi:MAG: aminoglycoside phosphotransferase family protein [Candidatus Hermodarchaeota archaeon]
MSLAKTKVNEISVKQFLQKKYEGNIENFQFIKGGQLSQAFSFGVANKEYIIKIRQDLEALEKEKSIFERISQHDSTIPVPQIYELGLFQEFKKSNLYYCISEKCEGKILYSFDKKALAHFKKPLIEILYKIHQIDISDTSNFGLWIDMRQAPFLSWEAFLQDYISSKVDYLSDFFTGNSEELGFIQQLEEEIRDLLYFCSEERHLIHGDYGAHNAVAIEPNKITGIIDWELSKFGDFVYDVAWLDYWGYYDNQSYKDGYQTIYESKNNQKIKNFEERLLCYKLCVGLHMSYFDCISGQLDAYKIGKKQILSFTKQKI